MTEVAAFEVGLKDEEPAGRRYREQSFGQWNSRKKSPEARKTMSCSRTRKVRVAREMGEEGGRNRAVRGKGSMCHDTKPVNALKIIKCL